MQMITFLVHNGVKSTVNSNFNFNLKKIEYNLERKPFSVLLLQLSNRLDVKKQDSKVSSSRYVSRVVKYSKKYLQNSTMFFILDEGITKIHMQEI